MTTYQIVVAASLIATSLAVALIIAAVSRHKKSAIGELDLRGSLASVETSLAPEGAVLIRGELWRARLRSGGTLERGQVARVVGASGHLLEVEPHLLGTRQD